MLLALPIILVAVASYIQFAFIQGDGYEWFRPFVWDALEDLMGIMRRRMPLWMQPISMGDPRLMLPAPIPTKDLFSAIDNQSLVTNTSSEVSISGFIHTPFETLEWTVLRFQDIRKTYFFNILCGVTVFLCLAGLRAWLVDFKPTTRSCLQKCTQKSKANSSSPLVPPAYILDFELILPNRQTLGRRNTTPQTILSPPMGPTTPEYHIGSAVLDIASTPATAPESTWRGLRIRSPATTPNGIIRDLSRHWRRDCSYAKGGDPCTTSRGRTKSGSYHQPNSRISAMPRITVNESPKSSSTAIADICSRTGQPTKRHLGIESLEDTTSHGSPANGSNGCNLVVSEPTPGDLLVGNSGIGISTVPDPSGDSTPRATPISPGCHVSFINGTLNLVQTPINLCAEEILDPTPLVSASWVESIALRDSLVPHLDSNLSVPPESVVQHTDHSSSVNSFERGNAWANKDAYSSEPENTGVPPNISDPNDDNAIYLECAEHLHTASNSSTSIEWMSQRSILTDLDTPLITPSNSVLPVPGSGESSRVDAPLGVSYPSMDFAFENQLSQVESSPGSPSMAINCLDSFAKPRLSGVAPANSYGALSSHPLESQSFLDDRTYAEVAGVPSDIGSAWAAFTLERWRVPRSSSSRPQSNGPSSSHKARDAPNEGASSWAAYGTATSMWARVPDSNSRGFGNRRGRGGRAQNV
ncbi:unnamed protein product [Rhizoctonia solani]|uniref:Transmembrane protein n=1 Tax=Rhizoctonia solani TaxID=456999 RepID=A0A8H3A7G6_9AGAM|nr:unnamed protein product [Rhizoctonia solani]